MLKQGIQSNFVNIQPKLTVGSPDDPYEKEADAMAERILRPPETSFLQTKISSLAVTPTAPLIQRVPNTPVATSQPSAVSAGLMDRAAFVHIMNREFGVTQVITGTQAMQETMVGQPIPGWQSWEPDAANGEYQQIVDAFYDFRNAFSATPLVTQITFFEKKYILQNGVVTADTLTGAQFGITDLTIFRTGSQMRKPLPLDRSNRQGNYTTPPGLLGVSYSGSSLAAPLVLPREQGTNFRRVIAHELGHGLQSAAMNLPNPGAAIDPTMQDDYNREVGWTPFIAATGGNPAMAPRLYDISVTAVQVAIQNNTTPPPQYEITTDNWNDPNWGEQPMTAYSLSNPGDDFADSVMAFVYEPHILQRRSPRRYNFLYTRRPRWLPRMLTKPEIGDFPDIPEYRHLA